MTLKDMMVFEENSETIVNGFKNNIRRRILASKPEETELLDVNMGIVKLSSLQKGIISPEYYLPSKQADYVSAFLSSAKRVSDLFALLHSICDNKYVVFCGKKYQLNSTSLNIISETLKLEDESAENLIEAICEENAYLESLASKPSVFDEIKTGLQQAIDHEKK